MSEQDKNKPETDNEEQEEYINTTNVTPQIKDKLVEASKRYPIWTPKKEGDTIHGTVEHVEYLEHLNENNGGYLIRMVDDKNNKFVVFPNKVLHKKLQVFSPDDDICNIVNMSFYIQFDKEQQPRDARLKPYKTYSVIEG